MPAAKNIPQEQTLRKNLDPTTQPRNDSTLVGVKPWSTEPYTLPLTPDYVFTIVGQDYLESPTPTAGSIVAFLNEFSDNLEREYPPPSLSPQRASSHHFDLDSFTRYDLTLEVIAIIALRAPSDIVGIALKKLAIEIRKHGAPDYVLGVTGKHQGGLFPVRHYNTIRLEVQPLGQRGASN